MKILLFSRPQVKLSADDINKLFSLVEKHGFSYAINSEFAEVVQSLTSRTIEPEAIYEGEVECSDEDALMLCCGGDGTLLEGVHRLKNKSIAVAAINFGSLGFLTAATREGLDELFADIAQHRLRIESRTMLAIEGIRQAGGVVTALNEVAAKLLKKMVPYLSSP